MFDDEKAIRFVIGLISLVLACILHLFIKFNF